jgi:rubrerythrin
VFARRAERENPAQIARLFRADARAETGPILTHLEAVNGICSAARNLQEAITGESFESKKEVSTV